MNGPFRRTYPHLGDARPPTLETLPQAVAQNVAIARSRSRARIMAVVKADGYGHGACTVAPAAGRGSPRPALSRWRHGFEPRWDY